MQNKVWVKRLKHIRQKKNMVRLIYLLFEKFLTKNHRPSLPSWILFYIFFSELCRNNPLKEEIIIKIRTMRIKGKVKFSIYPR